MTDEIKSWTILYFGANPRNLLPLRTTDKDDDESSIHHDIRPNPRRKDRRVFRIDRSRDFADSEEFPITDLLLNDGKET
jgi:hypothetical protein